VYWYSLIHIFAIPVSGVTVRFMVLSTTFNNISFILLEETRVPGENHWQLYHIILYWVHLAMSEIRVEALMVIGTDCTDNCKSNYHAITTTSATIPDTVE
jgi:hypothetical protein